MRYTQHVVETPQSEPLPNQVVNSAGGFSFVVDDWVRLQRFLILGSEGGSYYATERKLTRENAEAVVRCFDADPQRAAGLIESISLAGRAPKNDPAIFSLALGASHANPVARHASLAKLNSVCRTATHLFSFVDAVSQMRGWGRGLRQAVALWYQSKSADDLALQVCKYRQRGGWSHRDVLRLCHALPKDLQPVLRFAATGKIDGEVPALIEAWSKAQDAKTAHDLAPLLDSGLTWEMIPTEFLGQADVWRMLAPRLPMIAAFRNLARMTASGALESMSEASRSLAQRLSDQDAIRKALVHPIQVLAAMMTYGSGHGARGSLTWTPIKEIVEALDEAFIKAFGNVKPSGKRLRVALDVSGSMEGGEVAGVPGLTPRIASAAMAMVWAKTEPTVEFQAFSHVLIPVNIAKCESVRSICQMVSRIPFGATDCSLPIVDALNSKAERDAFIVLTDSETWAGHIHPSAALKQYRSVSSRAKLCVVGMVSNGFSIADPNDGGMMDVVGFDTATPNLISDFVSK